MPKYPQIDDLGNPVTQEYRSVFRGILSKEDLEEIGNVFSYSYTSVYKVLIEGSRSLTTSNLPLFFMAVEKCKTRNSIYYKILAKIKSEL